MNFLDGQKLVSQKEFGKALNMFLNLKKNTNSNNEILIYFVLNNFNKILC